MLNQTQFVNELELFIAKHSYTPSDILVSHGGSMLLMGHRESTGDIDVSVSRDIWVDQIIKSNNTPVSLGERVWLLEVTSNIDIHIGVSKTKYKPLVHASGFLYNGREQTLLDYMALNRDKDQESIRLLRSLE